MQCDKRRELESRVRSVLARRVLDHARPLASLLSLCFQYTDKARALGA